jgi:L-amino acid N-acyltransferase YncA
MSAPESDPPFDGDPAWRVRRHIADGTTVLIRPIAPEDRDELQRGFAAMSPRSRYMRFLGITNALSESTVRYLTEVDQKHHVALVAMVQSPDLKTERGVGVARFIRVQGAPEVAEAAITVIDEWQKRGVGTALAVELARAAVACGIKTIRAEVLADNETMIGILEQAGGKRVSAEDGMVSYDIMLGAEVAPIRERLVRVLRGAAETLGMTIRRLALPSVVTPPLAREDGEADEPEG